jgi:hypothetical protein
MVTVTLSQTSVYRRGDGRFLLSPPKPDYWGEIRTSRYKYLTMIYPTRDMEFANRLSAIVNLKIEELCRLYEELACSSDLQVEVDLAIHPESLITISDRESMLHAGLDIVLPAPSIVGQPVDEAGYQALLRGYSSHVLGAGITELLGWQCCHQGAFYLALLEKEVEDLELRQWPLEAADYESLLADLTDISGQGNLWREASVEFDDIDSWETAYAIVEFLLQSHQNLSPVTLQRGLMQARNFNNWLSEAISADLLGPGLNASWFQFLYERGLSFDFMREANLQNDGPNGPSPGLPDQDILLLCPSPETSPVRSSDLYRYDHLGQQWETQNLSGDFNFMISLPGDEGVVLQSVVTTDPRAVILQDGQMREVFAG